MSGPGKRKPRSRAASALFFLLAVLSWCCLAAIAWQSRFFAQHHRHLPHPLLHRGAIGFEPEPHAGSADSTQQLRAAACARDGCAWAAAHQQCQCTGTRPESAAPQPGASRGDSRCAGAQDAGGARSTPCGGAEGVSREGCLAQGCCWSEAGASGEAACVQPDSAPWETYRVVASGPLAAAADEGRRGHELQLQLVRPQLPQYGADFQQLSVVVEAQTDARLRVLISPLGAARWEVPQSLLPRPGCEDFRLHDSLYHVALPAEGEAFGLAVSRSGREWRERGALGRWRWRHGRHVFNTSGFGLVFKDQYLELTTSLLEDSELYGLGQRVARGGGLKLPREGQRLVLWNTDTPASRRGVNQYGSHPFLLQVDADGVTSGVLLLNSNGLEVTLQRRSLTYRAIGGLLELYLLLGPSPEDVMRQYADVVGPPAMPPLWALGFHQSRWGYSSVGELQQVVASYAASGLPLEVMWSDIDHMSHFRDFTFDRRRFPVARMRAFVDGLHAAGQRWVPIVDAGIAAAGRDAAFKSGVAAGVFIRDAAGGPYLGQVWPGPAAFPDFLARNVTWPWWRGQLQALHDKVPFDGIWNDMNEVSNFCSGQSCRPLAAPSLFQRWLGGGAAAGASPDGLRPPAGGGGGGDAGEPSPWMQLLTECQLVCEQPAPDDSLAYPPYAIAHGVPQAAAAGGDSSGSSSRAGDGPTGPGPPPQEQEEEEGQALQQQEPLPLGSRTIAMSARGVDGTRQYDAHNLYGLAQAAATHDAVAAVTQRRPFLLSRSTFSGSGAYTATWSGDNSATWADLRASVPSLLSASLAGLAMAGADICGFALNTTEELCTRWISAGAFYTFVRSHSSIDAAPQELYRWPAVADAARAALRMRYRLLPYLYTALFTAHRAGGTVARPLWFVAPEDAAARDVSDQWLLGDALLVSPVLRANASSRRALFPPGAWYDLWGRSPPVRGPARATLEAPLGHVPLHVRGGSIVPLQQAAATTREVRRSQLSLVVALDQSLGLAAGALEAQPACQAALAAAAAAQRGADAAAAGSGRDGGAAAAAAGDDDGGDDGGPADAAGEAGGAAAADAGPASAAAVAAAAPRDEAPLLAACGALYLDETGESLQVPDPEGSLLLHFTAHVARNWSAGSLDVRPQLLGGALEPPRLRDVAVLGLDGAALAALAARHADPTCSADLSYDDDGDGQAADQFADAPLPAAAQHQRQQQQQERLLHGGGSAGGAPAFTVTVAGQALPAAAVRYDAAAQALQLSAAKGWDVSRGLAIEWRLQAGPGLRTRDAE